MAYSLSPWLKPRFFITGTNRPLAGGLMYTYKAGTTDNATTYSDDAGTTNTNPIVLDSDGQCDLYLDDAISYRIILKNSAGVTQFDKDRIASLGSTQVQSFNSIAALRLRSGTTIANAAKTLGYYSAGDGGGNSFYWDGTSTATDNAGTVIKPTSVSGAGRWLAVDTSYINVKQFGAVGDGVADDTTAISSAIDEANTNGLPVLLESGNTYLCGALSKSRVHLVCLGSATIKAATGIAAGTSVITSAGILLDGVSVDGDNIVTRAVTATGKYKQRRSSISNVLGTAVSFGRLVYATSACTEFDVDDSCYFSGVSGVENGIEGDTSGADCGLYIEASLFSIVGATFTNIGGYEDGDCIRVQLPVDADLLWASAARSKIAHCKFPEIKKRAVKCQASDVLIYGNAVTSTVVTDPSCPYAAIDLYGSRNTVTANSIDLARAVSGIIDNGKNNVIEGNSVRVAAATAYTTARTSATSAIRNQSSIGSRVSKNSVISKTTSSFYVYQSEGSIHANNSVSGDAYTNQVGIYVDGGSGNLQIGNNIYGTSGAKLRYGVQVDNSVYNRVFSNIFQQMTAGIRYNGTTQASRNGGNVFGAGVSNVIDYTGAGASTAQTIGDHDGSLVTNVSPGSIAAHSTYSIDVSWPPFTVGFVYVVNPASSGTTLESGLLISIEPKSAGVATFKLHNITASPITPAARNYKIRNPM